MKTKIMLLSLLALVIQAQARPVVEKEAACAAKAWARTALKAGARVGAADVTTLTTDGGATLFASRLSGGGTVFLSGDTTRRPVIIYVASLTNANAAASIDRASPLWALLNADQGAAAVKRVAAAKAAANGGKTPAELAWDALLADGDAVAPAQANLEPAAGSLGNLSDVRVAALVKSTWDQSTVGSKRCYNYYTPELSSGSHAVCGCVATAMSQLMRYHQFPSASVSPVTRKCYVQASRLRQASAKDLTTQAGTYDWKSMPLNPDGSISDAQCKAIGKLTSDAGISVYMSYDTTSAGGSGAFMPNAATALREVFGYASACYYGANEVTANSKAVHHAMLSNFDAGYPILMGISGNGGHAIVADGYGYSDSTLYVHLNMGWSGSCNAWYNLPHIGAGYDFSVVDDIVFNIFPKSAGGFATLSGRVVDDEGNSVDGVAVAVRVSGEDAVTATDTTVKGVWGVRVPAGETYDVSVTSADGKMTETKTGVHVPATSTKASSFNGLITDGFIVSYDYTYVTSIGNYRDPDEIVLFQPTARIGESHLYSCLDKAIAGARDLHAEDPGQPVFLEVIDDSALNASVTVDFPLVLSATNSDFVVTRVKDAKINIASGGSVAVGDIAFDGSSAMLFDVAAGGSLEVDAGADFGVERSVAAVHTKDAQGFVLAGEPRAWFSVDCEAAQAVNQVFGSAHGDLATVTAWAANFVNLADVNGELAGAPVDEGSSPYALKWALLPVPLDDASAYYVVDGQAETTNCFRRLDRLFELFEQVSAPATVTVVKDGSLSRKVTPKSDLKIVSTTGAVVSNLTSSAGFVVNDGVRLDVSGLSFDGDGSSKLNALFLVDGGELNLGDLAIRNLTASSAKHSGVIAVEAGRATLGANSSSVTIENCVNPFENSCGGAVSLAGEDCSLDLRGRVTITGCSARSCGGAVYIDYGGAFVNLSGDLTIDGNTSGDGIADNIYSEQDDGEPASVIVTGPIAAGSRIGLLFYGADLSAEGGEFAAVDENFTDRAAIAACAAAFASDEDAELSAEVADDYAGFVWSKDSGGVKPVDPSVAVAHVDGVGYYASLDDAVAVLTDGSGAIELLRSTTLTNDLVFTGSVTLRSASGQTNVVTRAAPCALTVAAGALLSLADITLDGRLDEENGGDGPLVDVNAGGLILGGGATVRNVTGAADERTGAIRVYNGSLDMYSGAVIRDCANVKGETSTVIGCGGAITADSVSVLNLFGGAVIDCSADEGDAVFVANESTVRFSGDFTAAGVYVASGSSLQVAGALTGDVGHIVIEPTDAGATGAFGSVASDFADGDDALVNSAHAFANAQTGDYGLAVRHGSTTLLVWSESTDAEGNYTDASGEVYTVVSGGTPLVATFPTPAAGLVYNGEEQRGVEPGLGYGLIGGVCADAGEHTATVVLKPGFAWSDGESKETREVIWTIAPAPLAVVARDGEKQLGEDDPEFKYSASGFIGADTSETTLTGALARAPGEAAGVYEITQGTLAVIGGNYTIVFTGATFTITDPSPGPGPGPGPTPVTVQPIAFASIERVGEEWVLVATNATAGCEYSLRSGTTLETNTWAETSWTAWQGESGPMTNRVPVNASEPKRFWLILGRPTATPE